MWIVTIIESHYPSVFHFEEREDAENYFDFLIQNEEYKDITHLAKVERTVSNAPMITGENINDFDVNWYSWSPKEMDDHNE